MHQDMKLPFGKFRKLWEISLFVVTLSSLFFRPVKLIFFDRIGFSVPLSIVNVISDLFFGINFHLRLRYFYIKDPDNDDKLIQQPRLITAQYLTTLRFLFDFIGAIPIQSLALLALENVKFQLFADGLNLFRSWNYVECFAYFKRYLEFRYGAINTSILAICNVFTIMLLLLNLFGCALLKLSCSISGSIVCDRTIYEGLPLHRQLVLSHYIIAQTIFTVGYGDFPPTHVLEVLFMNFVMFVGVFLYALLIAIMTSAIANQDASGTEYKTKLDKILKLMDIYGISQSKQDKIERYFDLLNNRQGGKLENQVLAILPVDLHREIVNLERVYIEQVPLFNKQHMGANLMLDIVMACQPNTYPPKHVVAQKRTQAQQLIILRSGRIDVQTEKQMQLTTLIPGDYIGDLETIFRLCYHHNYVAVGYCDVFTLSIAHLKETFQKHDTGKEILQQMEDVQRKIVAKIHYQIDSKRLADTGELQMEFYDLFENLGNDSTTLPPLADTIQAHLRKISRYDKQLTSMIAHLGKSKKKNKFFDDLENSSGLTPNQSLEKYMIPANSIVKTIWDASMLCVILYFAADSPIRIQQAYVYNNLKDFQSGYIMDYFFDVLLVLDILLNLFIFEFTKIEEEDARVCKLTWKDTVQNYATDNRPRFINDVVASLPYELIVYVLGVGYYPIFRGMRLLKILYFKYYLSQSKENFENHGYRVSSSVIGLTQLILSVAFFTVLSGCIWSALHFDHGDASMLSALYWSLTTITTIGFGDITPETTLDKMYTIAIIIVGTTMGAGTVANISSLVHNVAVNDDNFEHRQTCVVSFLSSRGLPNVLVQHCERYFKFEIKQNRGLSECIILNEYLPDAIRNQVLLHSRLRVLYCSTIFDDYHSDLSLSTPFLQDVALLLTIEVFTRGEIIVQAKRVCPGMYFIKLGDIAATLNAKEKLLFGPGSCFGEVALYDERFNNIHCTAGSIASLFLLDREQYSKLQLVYPKEFEYLREQSLCVHRKRWFGARLILRDKFRGAVRKIIIRNKQDAPFKLVRMASKKVMSRSSALLNAATRGLRGSVTFGSGTIAKNSIVETHQADGMSMEFSSKGMDPIGKGQNIWRSVLLGVLLVNSFTIPLGSAFTLGIGNFKYLLYFGDCLLLMDITFQSRYFKFNAENKSNNTTRSYSSKRSVVDLKQAIPWYQKLSQIFRHGELLMDVLAVIPLEVITLGLKINFNQNKLRFMSRILKLLHFRKIKLYIDGPEKLLRAMIYKRENIYKVSKLLAMLLLTCHWFGCIWFFIAIEGTNPVNWAVRANVHDASYATQYIASLYWAAFTLTTVGYGDISPTNKVEQLFATFVLVCGTGMYTIVIGNLEEIVSQLDVTSTLYQEKREALNTYVQYRHLSPACQEKISLYLANIWKNNKGVSQNEILGMMPRRNRQQVLLQFCKSLMLSESLFKNCSSKFLTDVVLSMVPTEFCAGDMLFEKHACSTNYIVLLDGSVDFLSEEFEILLTKSAPCILCEGDFLMKVQRVCHCRVRTYSNVLILYSEEYDKLLLKYPHDAEVLSKLIASSVNEISTRHYLQSLDKNLKNSKMAQMMAIDTSRAGLVSKLLLPDSYYCRLWTLILFYVSIYSFITVPYRLAFLYSGRTNESNDRKYFWLMLDGPSDLINFATIWLRFNYFARDAGGFITRNRKELRSAYKSSTDIWLDLIIAFPLQLLAYILGFTNAQSLVLCRLPQMLNAIYISERVRRIIDYIEEQYVHYSIGVWQAVKMFSLIILLSHWLACFYFILARIEGIDGTWVEYAGLADAVVFQQYVVSLYWAVYTITTVGFGDVIPVTNVERCIAIVAMFIAAMLCDAGLTAILSSLIDTHDAKSGENVRRVNSINKYLIYRKVPPLVRQKVQNYLLFFANSQHGIKEAEVLNLLSPYIRGHVICEMCFTPMSNTTTLSGIPPGFVRSVVQNMYPLTVVPKQVLHRIGVSPKVMHCVIRGFVEVVPADSSQEVYYVTTGSTLGNFDQLNQRTLRAMTFCEVFCLDEQWFQSCLRYALGTSVEKGNQQYANELHTFRKEQNDKKEAVVAVKSIKRRKQRHMSVQVLSAGKIISEQARLHKIKIGIICDVILLFFSVVNSLIATFRLGQLTFLVNPFEVADLYYIIDMVTYSVFLSMLWVHRNYSQSISSTKQWRIRLVSAIPLEIVAWLGGAPAKVNMFLHLASYLNLMYTSSYLQSASELYLQITEVKSVALGASNASVNNDQQTNARDFGFFANTILQPSVENKYLPAADENLKGKAKFKHVAAKVIEVHRTSQISKEEFEVLDRDRVESCLSGSLFTKSQHRNTKKVYIAEDSIAEDFEDM